MEKTSQKNFQTASFAVSETKAFQEQKVVWELRNWKDPKPFQVLRNYATSKVYVEGYSSVYLLLTLKEERETIEAEKSELVYLSLNISRIIGYPDLNTERHLREVGLTVYISVDYLNEKLKVEKEPLGYQSVPETSVSFDGPNSLPSTVTLMKKFILLHKSDIVDPQTMTICTPLYYERPDVLRYGITTQLFNCNNFAKDYGRY